MFLLGRHLTTFVVGNRSELSQVAINGADFNAVAHGWVARSGGRVVFRGAVRSTLNRWFQLRGRRE